MKKRLLTIPVAVALTAFGLSLGIPVWLASGDALTAPAPDFTTDSGWIYRPETPPSAVWEEGWGIDFILLPHTPETLDQHGVVATGIAPVRDAMIADSASMITLLSQHGAVYMPALRVETAATQEPNMNAARQDLAAALGAYFEHHNRGRGVALVAQDDHAELLISGDLLIAPDLQDVADRFVLTLTPNDVAPAAELPLLVRAPLPAGTGDMHLASLLFLPNMPTLYDTIADEEAASAEIELLVADAIERLESHARKIVEPFGEMQHIDVPPINLPEAPGAPGSIREDPTPG